MPDRLNPWLGVLLIGVALIALAVLLTWPASGTPMPIAVAVAQPPAMIGGALVGLALVKLT